MTLLFVYAQWQNGKNLGLMKPSDLLLKSKRLQISGDNAPEGSTRGTLGYWLCLWEALSSSAETQYNFFVLVLPREPKLSLSGIADFLKSSFRGTFKQWFP